MHEGAGQRKRNHDVNIYKNWSDKTLVMHEHGENYFFINLLIRTETKKQAPARKDEVFKPCVAFLFLKKSQYSRKRGAVSTSVFTFTQYSLSFSSYSLLLIRPSLHSII